MFNQTQSIPTLSLSVSLSLPDSFWGIVFFLNKLLSSLLDGLNTVFVGIKLSLKVLVFLNFGLKIGRVLLKKLL